MPPNLIGINQWNSIIWEGSGLNEIGRRADTNEIVRIDERYFRPTEVDELIGNSEKAFKNLDGNPSLKDLIEEMTMKI